MSDDSKLVARLWHLHLRGLSYASDKPAVNLLLADLSKGLKQAADRIEAIGNTRITPGSDLRDALVEAAYREAWHEGYATGDAGGSYGAVENDWLSSDARAALTKDDHGGGQTEEDRANPRLREDRAGAPSGLSPSVSSKAAHRISQGGSNDAE